MVKVDENPSPASKVLKCAVCAKHIKDDETYPYAPFKGTVGWRKSKRTVEFVDRSEPQPVDSPYFDICKDCFCLINKRMVLLKFFRKVHTLERDKRLFGQGRR